MHRQSRHFEILMLGGKLNDLHGELTNNKYGYLMTLRLLDDYLYERIIAAFGDICVSRTPLLCI